MSQKSLCGYGQQLPEKAPDEAEYLTLTYKNGDPVAKWC